MQQTATRQVKGVFFDLYGTLLILGDMKRAWSDWIEVLYGCVCPPELAVDRERFGDCCHQFFGKEEPAAEMADGLTVFERRIHRLAASLGSHIELPLLQETASRAVTVWQMHVQPDPDAPDASTASNPAWVRKGEDETMEEVMLLSNRVDIMKLAVSGPSSAVMSGEAFNDLIVESEKLNEQIANVYASIQSYERYLRVLGGMMA